MKDEQNPRIEFVRIPCKEGFIDMWTGDCGDDPNSQQGPGYRLNAMATYFRLNGAGEWVRDRHFDRDFKIIVYLNRGSETAFALWENHIVKKGLVRLVRPVIFEDGFTIDAGHYFATILDGFAYLDDYPKFGITLKWVEVVMPTY